MNARATPAPRARTVVLAGTSGGAGTTTVAALLFAEFSTVEQPRLLDRSDGELGRRLTGGDEVDEVSAELTLHDLGPHAGGTGLDRLDDPHAMLLVVTGATPKGIAEADAVLAAVRQRHGPAGLVRSLVVAVGVFGRVSVAREVEALRVSYGRRSVLLIPRDPVLAGGGRIPANRLSAETRRAQARLAHIVRERLRTT